MRRILSVVIAVLTIALAVVAAPAFADEVTDSDVKPDKAAAIAAFDFREVDHPVALHCRGGVTDRGPVVSCGWRADEHLEIAGWQLWRLQIHPASDRRTQVAELGASVTSYIDATVSAPAAYLYVVLGLDRAGEIVALSRPDLARVAEHRPEGIHLSCYLQRAASDTAAVSETSDVVEPAFEPAIGCRWERSDHADDLDGIDQADESEVVRAALGDLNPRYQRALTLRYLADLEHAEAARAMGVNPSLMAVLVHRATTALRKAMEARQEGEASR